MAVPMIFALTPVLGWSWPALTPILVATAGSLGYGLITTGMKGKRGLTKLDQRLLERRMVELKLDEFVKDVVAEQVGYDEELHFQKEDILVTFGHDARGRFFIRVTGPKHRSAADLKMAGEEFARSIIQQFVYNRLATELDRRGVQVVEETVDEEGNMVLQTRRW